MSNEITIVVRSRDETALRERVTAMRGELDRLGQADPFGQIFDNKRIEHDLGKVKDDITRGLDDAGRQGAQEFAKGLSVGFEMPGIKQVLVGSLVALAPLIGAAINGALLTGAGFGGIALGIVGQLKNPQVKSAFHDMGHELESTLTAATASFAGPLEADAHTLGGDLQQALRSIDFSALSKLVEPLASGLGGLVTGMMPGFNEALRAAQPIIAELARELPILGSAISDMFHEFAGSSRGAEEGLRTVMMLLIGLVEVTGHVVGALSNAYEWVVKFADGFAVLGQKIAHALHDPALEKLFDILAASLHLIDQGTPQLDGYGRSLLFAASGMGSLADAAAGFGTASQEAAQQVQTLFTKMMGVDQGTLSWNQSLTSLHDTLAQHRHTLNEATKDGQANVGAILSAVQANMQLYQAQVAAGLGADDAAKAYDGNEQALERQLHAMHYSQAEIDGLVGKYRGLPDAMSPAQRALQHVADAVERLSADLELIFHLPSHKDFSINVALTGVGIGTLGSLANQIGHLVSHHAAGGAAGGTPSGVV